MHGYNALVPLLLFNKPHRVLSQFTNEGEKRTLASFIAVPDVYPAGRLDYDSEGLLALTDDGKLQARISQPGGKLAKHYWAQVEGIAEEQRLRQLQNGVRLKDGPARALSVGQIAEPENLWPRDPPIRVRRTIPDCWIDVVIGEGRNRQVRRMTAAVGLPTLRLIRHRIGPWTIQGLLPGEVREIPLDQAWRDLADYRPFD